MKQATKTILERLNELKKIGKNLRQTFDEEGFKRWICNVQSTFDRLTSNHVNNQVTNIISKRPFYITFGGAPGENLHKQTIEHYQWQLDELIPRLQAVYDDISFFEEEEIQKETSRIKKYFEIEGGIPGIIRGKWGAKEK